MPLSFAQRTDFGEATAFERYVIAASIPAHDSGLNAASVDLRRTPGEINVEAGVKIAVGLSENLSAGAVTTAVGRMRPLIFGAAFKIVDLALELALETSGLVPSNQRRWRIDEKVAQAGTTAGDLDPLTNNFPELWARICALYVAWEEVRHSLVHRTARVDPATGELVGQDSSGNQLQAVSAQDQEQFARIASEVSEAVVTGALSPRSVKRLAWRLNQVKAHHGLADLTDAAAPGTAVQVFANLEKLTDGRWLLDARTTLDKARGVFAQANEFDGSFHALVEGKDRTFTCRLEEAPETVE